MEWRNDVMRRVMEVHYSTTPTLHYCSFPLRIHFLLAAFFFFGFDFFVPGLRDESLDGLTAFFSAATSDDYVPVAGLGERSSALETQAGVSTRHDGGVHLA